MNCCLKYKLRNISLDKVKFISLDGEVVLGRIIDVYDGDTFTCILPYEDGFYKFKCRLNGIDCPELRTNNPREKEEALKAKNFVVKYMNLILRMECGKFDKYGRLLVNVLTEQGDLSKLLIDRKLGVAYDGGTKKAFSG